MHMCLCAILCIPECARVHACKCVCWQMRKRASYVYASERECVTIYANVSVYESEYMRNVSVNTCKSEGLELCVYRCA